MSSLYDFVRDDTKKIKTEIGDSGSHFPISLSKFSTSLSLLHEKISKIDEKNVMMLKNIKKDISVLNSELNKLEKKGKMESIAERDEIKDEILKHSAIVSHIDISAVFTSKLSAIKNEIQKRN